MTSTPLIITMCHTTARYTRLRSWPWQEGESSPGDSACGAVISVEFRAASVQAGAGSVGQGLDRGYPDLASAAGAGTGRCPDQTVCADDSFVREHDRRPHCFGGAG